ncbi:MAG: lipase [Firmicutes bacterium HGW-Firmicutes-9]|jgi:simple sugar transport system ATP-binding protein|nr:MAG: lipase [Firmicutes bacterium HGW-Firmicutes-9]
MSDVILRAININKSFAGVHALTDVNLTIRKGEVRCLIGENGCGKSTLIKVISGVYTPDSGELEVAGHKFGKLQPDQAMSMGIQVIYQDFSIFPNLTVADNIAMNTFRVQKKKLINWRTIRRKAQEALDHLDVKIDLDVKAEALSVADKQIVAICRAIIQDAKLIIMDEPTTALTKKEVSSLLDIIRQLKEEGISVIFVTHKLEEVIGVTDTVTILRNGVCVVDGEETSNFDANKLAFYMTGHEIVDEKFVPEITNGKELLRIEKLSLKDGFNDITLTVNSGDVLGVTGLLGSGRTELAQCLFGQFPATSGEIFIEGKPVKIRSVKDAIRNGIGYVPEDRLTEGLFLKKSIASNIFVSVIEKFRKALVFSDNRSLKATADRWVKELLIKTPDSENIITTLSGGNQQRVVLAKWLARNPKILILNGPTVGVDIGSKLEIHKVLRKLANQGIAIIIISDDIPEVLTNCNKVVIMKMGRIVGEMDSKVVKHEQLAGMLA